MNNYEYAPVLKSGSERWRFMAGLFALIVADCLALAMAYVFATPWSQLRIGIYSIMVLGWLSWALFVRQSYTRRYPFWVELKLILQALFVFGLLGMALKLVLGSRQTWSGVVGGGLLLAFLLPFLRSVARRLLSILGLWVHPTVVFGSGENAIQACLALRDEPGMGYGVRALLVPPNDPLLANESFQIAFGGEKKIPIMPWPIQASDVQYLNSVQCVIAVEADQSDMRDELIRSLSHQQVKNIHVIPAMRGVPLFGLGTTQFFSHELLMIHISNYLSRPILRLLKRLFDLFGASILLIVLSPLFLLLGYKVSRDGGSVFFGHERIGQSGKPFKCYKFRSMVVNAQNVLQDLLASDPALKEEWDRDFKLKDDPRISKIGSFLRRTSLDELPQLWNVIEGNMSLVGPRPVVREELLRYGEDVVYYLLAKPGITGMWQVSGRNDVDYETRVYFDSWYVKNWSLWTDIAILFKTISVVLKRRGAY